MFLAGAAAVAACSKETPPVEPKDASASVSVSDAASDASLAAPPDAAPDATLPDAASDADVPDARRDAAANVKRPAVKHEHVNAVPPYGMPPVPPECAVPFTLDARGVKHYKPECFK